MNILYLSHLNGSLHEGPSYSVPRQIEAQSKTDNVFWYNATKSLNHEWSEYSFYHDIEEFPEESIKSLPHPFNNPDIIIVELFYNMVKSPLLFELLFGKIPYLIIPRGELTKQAQHRKSIKKQLANMLVCKAYSKKAAAIQYLTEQEYRDSGDKWNRRHLIISNGISIPEHTKSAFSAESIKCISIGRIEPYQKGLDLLIEACFRIKKQLTENNCSILICGPDKENKLDGLKGLVKDKDLSSIISFHDGVFGKEKEEMLLSHDVFLIPSRFEGHPMALLEALSYGLPALATTGSNMRKEIDECSAGWTADNSVEGIEKALLEMLCSKDQFEEKRSNAIKLAEQYAWSELAKLCHDEYCRLLG